MQMSQDLVDNESILLQTLGEHYSDGFDNDMRIFFLKL